MSCDDSELAAQGRAVSCSMSWPSRRMVPLSGWSKPSSKWMTELCRRPRHRRGAVVWPAAQRSVRPSSARAWWRRGRSSCTVSSSISPLAAPDNSSVPGPAPWARPSAPCSRARSPWPGWRAGSGRTGGAGDEQHEGGDVRGKDITAFARGADLPDGDDEDDGDADAGNQLRQRLRQRRRLTEVLSVLRRTDCATSAKRWRSTGTAPNCRITRQAGRGLPRGWPGRAGRRRPVRRRAPHAVVDLRISQPISGRDDGGDQA